MQALLDDLVEFNRTKLGLGIHVVPTEVDVQSLFADELAQLRAVYPQHRVQLEVSGDPVGCWDAVRLQQLLGNLVVNAIKYGSSDEPVRVSVKSDDDVLRFEVRNSGGAIDPQLLAQMFDPLKRGLDPGERRANTAVSGSASTSRARLPRRMVVRLKRGPTTRRRCSRFPCLAAPQPFDPMRGSGRLVLPAAEQGPVNGKNSIGSFRREPEHWTSASGR